MYSAVSCAEEHNTRTERFSIDGGIEASVVLRCSWADRQDLMDDILANVRAYPSYTLTKPPRAISCAMGTIPGAYIAVGQQMEYEEALVTVNYSTKVTDLISESIEPTVEFTILDWKRFRWGAISGDPLTEGEAPGRQVRGLNLVRTYYRMEPPLPVALLNLMGTVNNSNYTSALLGLTFGAETLLYQPPALSRVIKSNGDGTFNVTLKFAYKSMGWNVFWRSKTQTYSRIFDVQSGQYNNFPLANYSAFLS